MRKIVIALPKEKRLIEKAYGLFQRAGYSSGGLAREIEQREMKQLEFQSDNQTAVFLLVRSADIPRYVDKNWADIGISASDCYREYELSSVNATNATTSMRGDNFASDALPDLRLCENARFCVAGRPEKRAFYEKCRGNDEKILEVATQYPNITAKYFTAKNMIVDIIPISGSAELMPNHGEVDVIFDIVETGRALEKNGLTIFEEAMPIQTKFLVSRAALKYDENVARMVEVFRNAIEQKSA